MTLNRSTNEKNDSVLSETLHIPEACNSTAIVKFGVSPRCCMCAKCGICNKTRAPEIRQQTERSATPHHTHTVIITHKSAVCCLSQHSMWGNRVTVGLKGLAASSDTSQSLPQRGLVSPSASLLCFTLN